MMDPYYVNFEEFTLEKLAKILSESELIPSQKILSENISEQFAVLEAQGARNMKDLLQLLGTKKKVERFAELSGLPLDYLTILSRYVRSYKPSAIALKDIPGLDDQSLTNLAEAGIKQTKQLFDRAKTFDDRRILSELTGVSENEILEVAKLSDLARIRWVGPVFARMIFATGIDTVEKFSQADPEQLYDLLKQVNDEQGFTRANFTVKDIVVCVAMAKELPLYICY